MIPKIKLYHIPKITWSNLTILGKTYIVWCLLTHIYANHMILYLPPNKNHNIKLTFQEHHRQEFKSKSTSNLKHDYNKYRKQHVHFMAPS